MEFERAIFRVYERSIDGLVHDEPSPTRPNEEASLNKTCQLFEFFLFFSAFSFLLCLFSLHISFVGNPGCLPNALMLYNTTTNVSYQYQVRKDDILGINIRLGRMEKWKSSSRGGRSDDDYMVNQWGAGNINKKWPNIATYSSHVLHSWMTQSYRFIVGSYIPEHNIMAEKFQSWTQQQRATIHSEEYPLDFTEWTPLGSPSNISSNSTSSTIVSEVSLKHLLNFDYVVAFDEAVFLLDNDVLVKHHFRIINVTLSADSCFGGPTIESLLSVLNVFDLAVVNNVIYTTKIPGYMATRFGSIYHWSANHLHQNHKFQEWLCQKLSILFNSFLAFFLLSTTTTLLVRVLITSGVILIFPTFWLLRCCGVSGLNLRIVSFSYPWIGYPLQVIRAAGQSPYPFILAHLCRVMMYYLLYVAAQAVYISWLYNDVTFGAVQLWLYVVMMLWEYYTMIYLRAATSIEFFPRASLLLFLLYHVYYYSFPSGFHLLALTVMVFLIVALMTHCVRVYEVKAYRQGLVSFDQPRMMHINLPWPSWRYDIAPDYTMFMPLNTRTNSLYQDTIPARPHTADGEAPAATPPNEGNRMQRNTNHPVVPGPDPTVGPFATSTSGSIELSSLFRRRSVAATTPAVGGTNTAVNNAPSTEATTTNQHTAQRAPYSTMNSLFGHFFPSSTAVVDYQSLSSTSLHDGTSRNNRSTARTHNSSGSGDEATISAIHRQQQSPHNAATNEDDHII